MSTKKQSPKNNQEDVFLRWKTEAREILIQESNEKLVELTQQIGQTVRSNIQRGIVEKSCNFCIIKLVKFFTTVVILTINPA